MCIQLLFSSYQICNLAAVLCILNNSKNKNTSTVLISSYSYFDLIVTGFYNHVKEDCAVWRKLPQSGDTLKYTSCITVILHGMFSFQQHHCRSTE